MKGLTSFLLLLLSLLSFALGERREYKVIMWSTDPAPKDISLWFQRLREMGVDGEECYRGRDPSPFVQNGFGFYVENLLPELAFHHNRRPIYQEDWDNYTKTHDKRYLIRKPCFDDPAFWVEVTPYLEDMIKRYAPHKPFFYNLQDEPSITDYASPMDYCFCPHTLKAFRDWLKERYRSLETLNAEWETNFSSWEEVVPMTTYEIKERERKALREGKLENYAPWADHRAYMDLSFARTIDGLKKIIKGIDPRTPVGLEGLQMPSTWGGYDLYLLSQVLEWAEPYDICNSREIFRSFMPKSAPILSTVFGTDYDRIRLKLWWLLLHGDSGCLVWDDENARCIDKTRDDLPLKERGKRLGEIFRELKELAPLLLNAEPVVDPIAIHYSQSSIRAHWMFDSREDGDTWPRRFSSYEAKHSRFALARDAMVRLVEDCGFQFKFISSEEIERGELVKKGYKVLLLPQSVSMSPRECKAVADFVKAGGVVIADNMTATMDEHCRRLHTGQLDDLFGIRRESVYWHPEARGGEIPQDLPGVAPLKVYENLHPNPKARFHAQAPAVIVNKIGRGRTVYLNLDLRDYGKLRLQPPKGYGYRELFRQLLKEAGLKETVRVLDAETNKPADCVEVWRYKGEGKEYIAIIRNPEFRARDLQEVGYPDNSALEKPLRVKVLLERKRHIFDVRARKDLGVASQVQLTLEPWRPLLLELQNP